MDSVGVSSKSGDSQPHDGESGASQGVSDLARSIVAAEQQGEMAARRRHIERSADRSARVLVALSLEAGDRLSLPGTGQRVGLTISLAAVSANLARLAARHDPVAMWICWAAIAVAGLLALWSISSRCLVVEPDALVLQGAVFKQRIPRRQIADVEVTTPNWDTAGVRRMVVISCRLLLRGGVALPIARLRVDTRGGAQAARAAAAGADEELSRLADGLRRWLDGDAARESRLPTLDAQDDDDEPRRVRDNAWTARRLVAPAVAALILARSPLLPHGPRHRSCVAVTVSGGSLCLPIPSNGTTPVTH